MEHKPYIYPNEEPPVLVGELKKPFGLKGFETALPGHPVFEFRDRYVLFLMSQTEMRETRGNELKVGYFQCVVPFYKETLKPSINFHPGTDI